MLDSCQGARSEALGTYVPVGWTLAPAALRCPVPESVASAQVHLLHSSLRVLEPCPGPQPAQLGPDNLPLPSAGWYPALTWMGTPGIRMLPPAPEHSCHLAVAVGSPLACLDQSDQMCGSYSTVTSGGILQPGESPFHSSHIFLTVLAYHPQENPTPDYKSYTGNSLRC